MISVDSDVPLGTYNFDVSYPLYGENVIIPVDTINFRFTINVVESVPSDITRTLILVGVIMTPIIAIILYARVGRRDSLTT